LVVSASLVIAALPRLSDKRWRAMGSALGMIAAAFAGASLLGFLYGAPLTFAIRTASAIAFPAATAILAAGLGVMKIFADQGLERFLRSEGPTGILVRRILPVVILLPIVLAYVGLAGLQRGWFDPMFGASARTATEIVIMLGLVWWTARAVEAEF